MARDLKRRVRIREPWASARTRQRRREFAATFDRVPRHLFGAGLELGGGDGFLASLLAPYCRSFVTTDSYRPRLVPDEACAVDRLVCDATALPFADASFEFIFSSSVLEHIRDLSAALEEMRRCLRPGGLMLHIVPSRTWKLLQLLFYYPHLASAGVDALLDRVTARREGSASAARSMTTDRWSDDRRWRLSLETVLQGAVPRVHGEYPNHVSEWIHFGAEAWAGEFRRHGLTVHKTLRLPLYSGYGFGLNRLRRLGEWFGLSAHNAFLVSDAPARPFAIDCFPWSGCGPRREGL